MADTISPAALDGESFDAVSCSFGLSDIDDLRERSQRLPGCFGRGFFAFSILHPCFPGWESKEARPRLAARAGLFPGGLVAGQRT